MNIEIDLCNRKSVLEKNGSVDYITNAYTLDRNSHFVLNGFYQTKRKSSRKTQVVNIFNFYVSVIFTVELFSISQFTHPSTAEILLGSNFIF